MPVAVAALLMVLVRLAALVAEVLEVLLLVPQALLEQLILAAVAVAEIGAMHQAGLEVRVL